MLVPAGQRYVMEANPNPTATNRADMRTNTPQTDSMAVVLPANSAPKFSRQVAAAVREPACITHRARVGDKEASALLRRPYRAPWNAELKALGAG